MKAMTNLWGTTYGPYMTPWKVSEEGSDDIIDAEGYFVARIKSEHKDLIVAAVNTYVCDRCETFEFPDICNKCKNQEG